MTVFALEKLAGTFMTTGTALVSFGPRSKKSLTEPNGLLIESTARVIEKLFGFLTLSEKRFVPLAKVIVLLGSSCG